MVIENQQVRTIVHSCRSVLRHDPTAQCLPQAIFGGQHHRYRLSLKGGFPHYSQHIGLRQITRHHTKFGIRMIQAKRSVSAMNIKILQLNGTMSTHSRSKKCFIKRPVSRKQLLAHENRTDKVVDKRGMHPMSAEITGSGKTVAQLPDTSEQMSAEPHGFYFLSIPAKRPVEKAI